MKIVEPYGSDMANEPRDDKTISVVFEPEDQDELLRCVELDKLTQSDVIRRAVRRYRKHLETVHVPPEPRTA